MPSWKSVFLRSAGFGIGAALTFFLVGGAWLWYQNRPKPPKPWNSQAVTAEYDDVGTSSETNELIFTYNLRNNTDFDFRVSEEDVETAVKYRSKEALGFSKKNLIKIQYPIFVPAKRGAQVSIRIPYQYPNPAPNLLSATAEERKAFREDVSRFVAEKLTNLAGFVLFDNADRYEINFPDGWKLNTGSKSDASKAR